MAALCRYMVGENAETMGNGVIVFGWVAQQETWSLDAEGAMPTTSTIVNSTEPTTQMVDERISTSVRYLTS